MAQQKAFAILDIKADAYMAPFFFSTVGQAVRAFKDLANDKSTSVARHPGDYKLLQIGTFDDCNGHLDGIEPVSLGFATDYVEMSDVPVGIASIGRKGA